MQPDGLAAARDDAWQIRRIAVECAVAHGTCHIGSSLSVAEILAVCYRLVLRPHRADRLLLSKGHAAAALYAALAVTGVLDERAVIEGYCADGGAYAGHPERVTPGVEATTGSLGHGLAVATGMCLADRMAGEDRRTICVLGDGELNEGSVWEAMALASHLRLASLTAIVDCNGFQGLGPVRSVVDCEPLAPRVAAFGWIVDEVDGHDCEALAGALQAPPAAGPRCVLARTVKGRGIPELEQDGLRAHYQSFRPDARERLLSALDAARVAA